MNRRDRRAARSQERAGGNTVDSQTVRLFNEALRLHQAGRLDEAAGVYRQILTLEPAHVESLQNLGSIVLAAGRFDIAAELFRRALALNETSGHHGNMASALTSLGQLDQAAIHCRRAIELNPKDKAAHISLGKLYLLQGQFADAEASLLRALAIDPSLADAHFYLGNLRSQQGLPQEAIESFLRVIEIKPDSLEAHNNLCIALMAQSKYAEAIAHYEQMLAYKPDFVAGYSHLASAHLRAGAPERALQSVRLALKLGETKRARSQFAECLQKLSTITYDEEMPDLLVRAMTEAWCRPTLVMGHGLNLLKADAEIVRCIERAAASWPSRLHNDQLFGPTGFKAVARHRVLRCMLENGLIGNVAMERFLTNARFCLLQAAVSVSQDDIPEQNELAFYAALARQCFINEYVYAATDLEMAEVEKLRISLINALIKQEPLPILSLVAYSAYAPLRTLDQSDVLLARPWPDDANALLTQQLRDPLEEIRLRGTIALLTPIEDRVSMLVQRQYEENPYPRWVKAPVATPKPNLDVILRTDFPSAEFRSLGKAGAVDLLVAGCGTGQQLLDLPQAIAGTRVLAVDLSLASLGYAKRQIEALGISNIEFGQADILQLGGLNRRFDVIECGGVLHHLGDPEAGWRELVALLRPNGFMRIALYSELARRQIVAVQKLVADTGYGRSASEIRRFRQEFLAHPDPALVRDIAAMIDFYTLSECRDLLFHVQEHRFTIPRIKAFLAANGLEFISFEVSQPARNRYAAQFPEDVAMTDLDRWHAFEEDNPHIFIGMYSFWVQKGAADAPPPALA